MTVASSVVTTIAILNFHGRYVRVKNMKRVRKGLTSGGTAHVK